MIILKRKAVNGNWPQDEPNIDLSEKVLKFP